MGVRGQVDRGLGSLVEGCGSCNLADVEVRCTSEVCSA